MTDQELDQKVAAWAKTQNRGVPAWQSLSGSAQAFWRDMYLARHGSAAEGEGANVA